MHAVTYDVLSSVADPLSSVTHLDIYLLNDKVNSPIRERHGATLGSVHDSWVYPWSGIEIRERMKDLWLHDRDSN